MVTAVLVRAPIIVLIFVFSSKKNQVLNKQQSPSAVPAGHKAAQSHFGLLEPSRHPVWFSL